MLKGYTAGGYGGQQQQQQQQQQNAGGYGNRNYGNGGNSYSGGSNSSYQQQQAGGGGGFFNNNNTYGGGQSSSQGQSYGQQQGFSSSPGGGRKTTADKHSVRPVTIKQLWSAVQATGDQPFKLDGCQLEQVGLLLTMTMISCWWSSWPISSPIVIYRLPLLDRSNEWKSLPPT